ncbi:MULTISPECIES: ATP-dependent DNA helicase RecG [unclassified Campylobacter]|uniref:ATP-dependent DNA helicase RecG n=1 Tax=unclassified Campylobacter TaxID=2593542 RepID=UPI001237C8D9|nr:MULTISPECIES: ATP-dependent DNA helicase RecG [unclassified Campylobacter]KAA6226037.1 ATP-dependent DNA helicase RecG [Campylobacter sp. LR196d]KAA6226630.1 ATP-dependent DNA helicase RecG [Campylobacter sp. LR286c]KAA6227560.1 ATP-dependent DNA helicase RecG [Campylobacter sp. LR185c]KAA6230000.1 ATP-dependent DNA helicase RecG [Campylobacter sp. LR291e]KAA8603313.1 ATP-dependent DNA helicase RecG [Campylobacter sp. LR185c]
MKLSNDDYKLFTRLNLKNVIDLALLLPKKIENLNLTKTPKENSICTQSMVIKHVSFNSNRLFGIGFCEDFNCDLNFVIFNARAWHLNNYKKGSTILFNATLKIFNNTWQISNPKILKQAGGFHPKYQITGIKDESIKNLIQKYVNYENLKESGLDDEYINFLLTFHKYDEESYMLFENLEFHKDKLKYIELYNFLRRLNSIKTDIKSHVIKPFDISDWLKTLPFEPTNDQIKAIEDIKNDLQSDKAKRRVIMGDVGCGKTLILLAAALMVYPKQAILMVPTSILANQIYEEAKKLLPDFINILFLTKNNKEKELNEKIKNANLIIGTHALLYIKSHQAVLIMIDEQHRFGSNQRQGIYALSDNELVPHFVQFSATPIPRTLSMIQSSLLNFSFIKQMPFVKDIQTICIQRKDFLNLKAKIDEEIAQNHQVIIIYPLVNQSDKIQYKSLEEASSYWQTNYKNVFITHGKDKNKDEILVNFRDKGDILLSTTVVEVGISLPRLSVIIIIGAERLGLASLHQLRGRVGRIGLKSFCYLYTNLNEIPQRLIDFSNTLDGFKIAEMDLKNRLSGDLIGGLIQHGNDFKFFDFANDEAILQKVQKDLKS